MANVVADAGDDTGAGVWVPPFFDLCHKNPHLRQRLRAQILQMLVNEGVHSAL